MIQIYRDKAGQIVLVDHKNRIASTSSFYFDSVALNNNSYKYHPEETVYTGVTVGNVHTGGTHTKSAHYTQSQYFSGNARISLIYAKNLPWFLVTCVQFNDALGEKAKTEYTIKDYLGEDGLLKLFKNPSQLSSLVYMNALQSGNVYRAMESQSQLASDTGIPIEKCKTIAKWLTNIAK